MTEPDVRDERRRSLAPLAVLAASLAATIVASLAVRRIADDRDRSRFEGLVEASRSHVLAPLDQYLRMLGSAAELAESDEELDRHEFTSFVDRQEVATRVPGAAGLAYVRRAPRSAVAALDAELARAHGPAITVHPLVDTPWCSPVLFIEPATPELRSLLGWDLESDPVRGEAIARAVATRAPVLTPPLRLSAPGSAPRAAVLMFVPVFDRDRTTGSRTDVTGFVVGAIGFRGFLDAFARDDASRVAVALHAGDGGRDAAPLATTGAGWPDAPRYERSTTFAIGGISWQLRVATLPEFDDDSSRGQAWLVAAAGGALGLALFVLMRRVVASRARAERATAEAVESREALRRSAEQFREITENIREVVWVTGGDGMKMLYASPNFERVWGRERSALLERPEVWLESIHPDDRARIAAALPKELDGTYDERYRIVRPDGEVRWIQDRATPIRDASGAVVRVIGTAADITELHEAQEALRRQAEHLRQAQKMEAVGRLAGGVAHDFNNLLTVICGYSRTSLERTDLAPPVRGAFEQIAAAGDRAASLTRQLLAFSRRQVLRPEVLDVNAVVAESVPLLQRLIGEDVELTFVADAGAGRVRADRTQLEQIVMNLAVNARDAMPDGGRLTIETRREHLDARYVAAHDALAPGDYTLIAVTDTGIGMSADTLTRIFEPFYTTKELGKGTGLGLATIYGVVRQSDGHVSVYSELGVGSTFRVYLPRVDAEVAVAAPATVRASPGSETILLVEDEALVRGLASEVLAGAGYRVLAADSGPSALALLESAAVGVDLVLTDTVMPRMNGRELAERLRLLRPGAPVLFMSGYTDDAIVRHGVLAPGIEFLEKPFTPNTLLARVRLLLDRRAATVAPRALTRVPRAPDDAAVSR